MSRCNDDIIYYFKINIKMTLFIWKIYHKKSYILFYNPDRSLLFVINFKIHIHTVFHRQVLSEE